MNGGIARGIGFLLVSLLAHSCGLPDIPGSTSAGRESILMFSDASGVTMTNAAAVGTEVPGNISRVGVELSYFSTAQLQFASSLTSALVMCRIEYSLNGGSNWATLISNFPASTTANANVQSGFSAIPSAAMTTVLLRAVIVGNGVLDPIIRYVRVDFK